MSWEETFMEKYHPLKDDELFEPSLSDFRPRPRRDEADVIEKNQFIKSGFLLLDFELPKCIKHDRFKIRPSILSDIGAFVAPVHQQLRSENEEVNAYRGLPYFSMGLSSVVSLITSRAVKASTDRVVNMMAHQTVDVEDTGTEGASQSGSHVEPGGDAYARGNLLRLGAQHPISSEVSSQISEPTRERWIAEILEMANLLFQISYEDYIIIMRAARLVQHAHLNRADDTGLAYYFLVSAIEAVSSVAAKKLPENIKGKKGDKFAKFILEFCKRDTWGQLEYPEEEDTLYHNEQRPEDWGADLPLQLRISEPDPYPMFDDPYYIKYQELYGWHDLTLEGRKKLIRTLENPKKILLGAYNFRSSYTHNGKQPALNDDRGYTRLFQAVYTPKKYLEEEVTPREYSKEEIQKGEWKKEERKGIYNLHKETPVVPSFQLLSFMAKSSLLNYVRFLGTGKS